MSFKKIGFFVILIVSVIAINNLARSIYTLWQKRSLVTNAKTEVEKQKQENDELKKNLVQVERPEFVEEEARDKLLLTKPGESLIVLSQQDLQATMPAKPKIADTRPNWKKWWDLFF